MRLGGALHSEGSKAVTGCRPVPISAWVGDADLNYPFECNVEHFSLQEALVNAETRANSDEIALSNVETRANSDQSVLCSAETRANSDEIASPTQLASNCVEQNGHSISQFWNLLGPSAKRFSVTHLGLKCCALFAAVRQELLSGTPTWDD